MRCGLLPLWIELCSRPVCSPQCTWTVQPFNAWTICCWDLEQARSNRPENVSGILTGTPLTHKEYSVCKHKKPKRKSGKFRTFEANPCEVEKLIDGR
eukprot:m.235348 g.235348  ORF g.235348 m.235348 type:complete len:97 (-) comp54311_c0_seq5:1515-1805(-)